jgi:methylenetetrahydrofolate dehydrogenase (NADP+)/methenyltetrahydrofolate cyclohydrolase
MIIDGNTIAQKVLDELRLVPVPDKQLAAVLVGDDAASLSFLKQKQKTAESLSVKFVLYQLADTLSQEELVARVAAISADEKVGGMIVQLPLPKQYDRVAVLNAISIGKDVDVLNGEATKVLAPAAAALKRVLKEINFDTTGKNAVVIGSGLLIGRPVVNWLADKTQSVSIINRGGYNAESLREADLVVTGTGVSGLVRGEHLKKGAVVIDFGYGRNAKGELEGDVDFESSKDIASYLTPTRGGMGPIVVAMLFSNFYRLVG